MFPKDLLKILITISFACVPRVSLAEESPYIGGLRETLDKSFVAEVGLTTSMANNRFNQISLMLFGHEGKVYEGINFSINQAFGDKMKAYGGFGGFVGEHEQCSYNSEENRDECISDYTAGLYPEVGIIFSIGRLEFGAYGRFYKTFDAGNNEYKMYGLRIGYQL